MNLPHNAILMGKDAIVLDYDNSQIHHYHTPNVYPSNWSLWASYSTEAEFEKALPNWILNLAYDDDWVSVAYFWIDLAALTNS